jgi:hypothetical protein
MVLNVESLCVDDADRRVLPWLLPGCCVNGSLTESAVEPLIRDGPT